MTYDGQDHNFKYDAFGRLVKVTRTAVPIGTSGIRAEYKYGGLGQRIGWHCDLNADDDVTTADPWMWFIYDDRWRIVNTYRLAYSGGNWNVDSSAKERFVHHASGIDGKGGSSYIDAVILSDRDLTNTRSGAADGTLEARLYHLQNWRNDLCAVADGYVIARHYRHSAYGTRTEIDSADYNRDGVTDFADYLDFTADFSTPLPRADFNNDGTLDSFDSADFTIAFNITSEDDPHSAPRGLYAGYEHDTALEYQGAFSSGGASIYTIESYAHVRHRVYSTELGRWTRRDPLGYHDGMGLYEYCRSLPQMLSDWNGMTCQGTFDDYLKGLMFPIWWPFIGIKYGPFDHPCVYQSVFFPQPPSNSLCNQYPLCFTYSGANARCFCKCAGNGPWSNYVRRCLMCTLSLGYDSHEAHVQCYAQANKHFPPDVVLLAGCFFKCKTAQDDLRNNGSCP